MTEVTDLRILRLAAMYEDAFEAFVQREAQRHLDERTRLKLAPLAPDRDQHIERVRALVERLESEVIKEDKPAMERAALLDIIEVERAAREFYLRHLDQLHDPDVVQLFHELATEEGRHVRIAEEALDALEAAHRREASDRDHPLRMIQDAEPALWEGTVDLERHPKRGPAGP